MAATSFYVGSEHNNRNNLKLSEDQITTRPRRKSSKANESRKNKTPQRGMGVEKLEQLRKINEMKDIKTASSPLFPYGFIPTAFADPATMNHVSMPFATFGGGGGGGGLNFIPPGILVQKMDGNSKELPSIPNFINCDLCDACYKGEPVVPLHRKTSTRAQGNMVMEYDFFPGQKSTGRYKTQNEMMMMMMMMMGSSPDDVPLTMPMKNGADEAAVAAASCVITTTGTTTTTAADDASTCIDLSLKLSY